MQQDTYPVCHFVYFRYICYYYKQVVVYYIKNIIFLSHLFNFLLQFVPVQISLHGTF